MKREKIMLEINRIEEEHCKGCEIKRVIRKEHGSAKELRYCQAVCKYGRTLVELGAEIVKTGQSRAYSGPSMYPTLENYEKLDRLGIPDKEKLPHLRIGSIHTLNRYKDEWGIANKRKALDMSLAEYQALSRVMNDRTICVYKGVKEYTLRYKKNQWGIL